jgi:hypothetical protein
MDRDAHDEELVLSTDGGKPAGTLKLMRQFFPAGTLTVKICEGRNMASEDGIADQDPYVILTMDSRAKKYSFRTQVHYGAGRAPVWNETFQFDVVDAADFKLVVMDKDTYSADDLVGEVTVDLASVYRWGVRDAWAPIKRKGAWGGMEHRGEVRLEVDFVGPRGVAFPQMRTDTAAHDDRERRSRFGMSPEELARRALADAQAAADEEAERAAAEKALSGSEFTDREVEAAFRQLDLDGNLVVAAAEVKHILVCMGELVTDAEVDAMVRMCDADGDGALAFAEFYQLAKHANPSDPAFTVRPEAEFSKAQLPGNVGARAPPGPPPVVVLGADGKPIMMATAADREAECVGRTSMWCCKASPKGRGRGGRLLSNC